MTQTATKGRSKRLTSCPVAKAVDVGGGGARPSRKRYCQSIHGGTRVSSSSKEAWLGDWGCGLTQ